MRKYTHALNAVIVVSLVLAFAIRLVFAVYQPNSLITPDSPGYYELGFKMVHSPGFKTYINEFRTPLYPMFLATLAKAVGFNTTNIYDPAFMPVGNFIADIQSIFGIIGILLLMILLVRIGFPPAHILFFTIVASTNILVFFWERSILTEGLATTVLLLTLVYIAKAMHTPSTKNFVLLWISYVLCFLLRPAFILLPIVTLPVVYAALSGREAKTKVIAVFFMSCMVPLLYIAGNSVYHDYRGIQRVGDIDILGRILEFGIPVETGKTSVYFYEKITEYRHNNGNPMPFEFINTYDSAMYINSTRMNELQRFTYDVLFYNLPSYTWHALATIPTAMTDISPFLKISDIPHSTPTSLLTALLEFYRISLVLTLLVFPLFPVALFLCWRFRSMPRFLLVVIGSVIVTQILFTVFVVYREDYGRLFAPLQPLFPIFIIGVLRELALEMRRT